MADSKSIESKLKQAWREERRFYHIRGASRFVIWLSRRLTNTSTLGTGSLRARRSSMFARCVRARAAANAGLLPIVAA